MLKGNYKVSKFINNFSYEDIPPNVIKQVKLCILDLLGAIYGGSQTKVAKIARDFAEKFYPGKESTIIAHKGKSSMVGATFANAFQANAIDIDDGYRPIKGHPGALIIPAALAVAEAKDKGGKELIEAVVLGYEIGIRAGIIWHDHYPVYHASGAWGSIATSAVTSKLLGLSVEETYHALGIAEYQAPINPMMRCIDYPAMVKDGIGWGSPTGVTSALMAANGFTGIPSLFGYEKYLDYVNSLGHEYNILNLYFKPYSCCRWAQSAITATLKVMGEHNINYKQIEKIKVYTYEESARLKIQPPQNTEEAQYNIAYPIAAAVVDGEVGPKQILDEFLNRQEILTVLNIIEVIHDTRFDKKFPKIAESEVEIITRDGSAYKSGVVRAKGDWDNPFSEKELIDKFRWLAGYNLEEKQIEEIIQVVKDIETVKSIKSLIDVL